MTLSDYNDNITWTLNSTSAVAASQIGGHFNGYSTVYGAIGLGINGTSLQNFQNANNFMLDLNPIYQNGSLILNQEPLP